MNVGFIKRNFNANPGTCGYGGNGIVESWNLKGTANRLPGPGRGAVLKANGSKV
jgi:hypothetical protein